VDESEAAFVGTLVDRHDGLDGQFGQESIFVFQVEEWVKGDAGDVIEVRSASDGAACGFEFWDEDMRIGAVIHEENGALHGSLCSQIDPDVLLAAMADPVSSTTGLGYLLAANGFNSTRLTVLDREGHQVVELAGPETDPFSGTQHLDVCPGGNLMVQTTTTQMLVWDLTTFELVTTIDMPGDGAGWPSDVVCRDQDASSILVIQGFEVTSQLIEMIPEPEVIMELPGPTGSIGSGFVVAQLDYEGDAVLIDLKTGVETRLTETPNDSLHAVYVAPHPSRPLVAVVETRFATGDAVDATLSVFDETGAVVDTFEIPWESYPLAWLDESRIAVTSHDWSTDMGQTIGYLVDIASGESIEIDDWHGTYAVADGDVVYGVDGGTIVKTDLETGSNQSLVTLASQSAGPLVLLNHSEPVTTATSAAEPEPEPTTNPTVPPLVAPEAGSDSPDTGYVQWVAGGALIGFLGVLAWLAVRRA